MDMRRANASPVGFQPTPNLRYWSDWAEMKFSDTRLQQEWVCSLTGEREWRNIPYERGDRRVTGKIGYPSSSSSAKRGNHNPTTIKRE